MRANVTYLAKSATSFKEFYTLDEAKEYRESLIEGTSSSFLKGISDKERAYWKDIGKSMIIIERTVIDVELSKGVSHD